MKIKKLILTCLIPATLFSIANAEEYIVTLPADASLEIGVKVKHFLDMKAETPVKTETNGDRKEITYDLSDGKMYSYRTWKEGGLTQAGWFKYSINETKCPVLNFAETDYEAFGPKTIVHDVQHNLGYETGDIFININERGHLRMDVGNTFKVHGMRTWELTDNVVSNNFIEPDFHYTVLNSDGTPSQGVIEITTSPVSAWADIKAVGNGTAIVLVTYDAICVNTYSETVKNPFVGGEFWSAIWPENTGVFVVTVGDEKSTAIPNMTINEDLNPDTTHKLAGTHVDAEHDVFYYLDTEAGATYTFTPEGVADVTIAYPTIGENMATYSGFGSEGVTNNGDGSYTLLLKHGRQIVKMTDAQGNCVYQVLTAKPCHREVVNASNPGSKIFQPGEIIEVQYTGLFHPANKLAGIYNMSAYLTYNGTPNGTTAFGSKNQYTFASAPGAQVATYNIPTDYDAVTNPSITLTDGVIQINGFGDPIGNHRNTDPEQGRLPNLNAVSHITYFGFVPDVEIPVSVYRSFPIRVNTNVPDAEITMLYHGNELDSDDVTGLYEGSYGVYSLVAKASGYKCYRNEFKVADDAEGEQVFTVEMIPLNGAWDGTTKSEPSLDNGVYCISNGAELAWYADQINSGNSADGKLTSDIDLGNFDWTPIGTNNKQFKSNFNGDGHVVTGLYINAPKKSYQGLFGYAKGVSEETPAVISGVTVNGEVTGKQYSAGIVGYAQQYTQIELCANNADVTGLGTFIGGVVGQLAHATSSLKNCYNTGNIIGISSCAGVVGGHVVNVAIENIFNIGEISGTTVGACIGGTQSKNNVRNAFAIASYNITEGHTLVTAEQMESGEVAHILGEAFGQTIGEELHPVFNGAAVYQVEYILTEAEPFNTLSGDADTSVLYTNGELPTKINDEEVTWYSDEAMENPVTTVDEDTLLYGKVKRIPAAVYEIGDSESVERWYNIHGTEVAKPSAGEHGIYIRVRNGNSEKIAI